MNRGDVWTRKRFGYESTVVILGTDDFTARCDGVLTVPISDVKEPSIIEPAVSGDGTGFGVALIPRLGAVSKEAFLARAGALDPVSMEKMEMVLRAALGL